VSPIHFLKGFKPCDGNSRLPRGVESESRPSEQL
jgi:hypothetical protein